MPQLSNLLGTSGCSEWVMAGENQESCPVATPSKRCLEKRHLWLKQAMCFRQPVVLSMKKFSLLPCYFFFFFFFSRRCRINDSSKLGISITKSKLKGAVSRRKKITSLLCFPLLFCTPFSDEILNSLKNGMTKRKYCNIVLKRMISYSNISKNFRDIIVIL